jgi:hypothetical protein
MTFTEMVQSELSLDIKPDIAKRNQLEAELRAVESAITCIVPHLRSKVSAISSLSQQLLR